MPLIVGAEPVRRLQGASGALLLHDLAGSPVALRPWADFLSDAGVSVALPLLPGHGTHWQDLNHATWRDWLAVAQSELDWLGQHCVTVTAIGLGNGGALALRLAEEDLGVDGLVLVNPRVHTESRMRHLLALHRAIPFLPGTAGDIKKKGVDEGAYDRLPVRAARSATQLWREVKTDIHRVEQPLLLFRSADDHIVEPSNSLWVLANVHSADRTEVVLHDSYHVAPLDNDAERVFRGSLDFLSSLGDAAGR